MVEDFKIILLIIHYQKTPHNIQIVSYLHVSKINQAYKTAPNEWKSDSIC
jgi:hypothetical protein